MNCHDRHPSRPVAIGLQGDAPHNVATNAIDAEAPPAGGPRPVDEARNAPGSCPAPFLSQLCPVLKPLPGFALEAAFGRVVEFLSFEHFRKIVLTGERL